MALLRIIKAVNVLADGDGCLSSRRPALSSKEFGLQAFEEGLDGGVVRAVSLARHGGDHLVLDHLFLEIVGAILAAAIGVKNATGSRSA